MSPVFLIILPSRHNLYLILYRKPVEDARVDFSKTGGLDLTFET
jgi:hypothetical protein